MDKLQHLQSLNEDLNKEVSETKKENHDLAWAKERLNRELEKLKLELSDAKEHLSTAEMDRLRAADEVKSMQQVLVRTKEEGVRALGGGVTLEGVWFGRTKGSKGSRMGAWH